MSRDLIDLRDYFIAHAPAEPQPWFRAVMPYVKPERPLLVRSALNDEERQEYDYFHEFFPSVKVAELKSQRLQEYAKEAFAAYAAARAWASEMEKQQYVQWPAAWADEMIKARTA